jgi:hypothetical protein
VGDGGGFPCLKRPWNTAVQSSKSSSAQAKDSGTVPPLPTRLHGKELNRLRSTSINVFCVLVVSTVLTAETESCGVLSCNAMIFGNLPTFRKKSPPSS